jgi:uncharacterized protein (DUF488 family)
MWMTEFVTIGVYGFDAASFFAALQGANVDTFCYIRRRRAVRGAAYAFANRLRLEARLAELGIRYRHFVNLAPGKTLRGMQDATDKESKIKKRQRATLSTAFVAGYQAECLAQFDSAAFVAGLGTEARIVALCCVEREPAACHRSVLAARLQRDLGVPVIHLLP